MNKILWTRRSLRDLDSIYSYIAQDNPDNARTVVAGIQKLTQRLSYHPFMGKPGRRTGTRELILAKTPFIVVYRVQKENIEVLRILHGAQKYL